MDGRSVPLFLPNGGSILYSLRTSKRGEVNGKYYPAQYIWRYYVAKREETAHTECHTQSKQFFFNILLNTHRQLFVLCTAHQATHDLTHPGQR